MQSLPDDIVGGNILSRLPVKTLLQIKFVCKLWNTIISHPHFPKLQLEQSNQQNNGNNHKLLVLSMSGGPPPISLDYENDDEFGVSELDFPLPHGINFIGGCGSCNGLLCVRVGKEIVLWNPSIKQYKTLPPVDGHPDSINFGYDSIHDDYKVVKVCYELRYMPVVKMTIYSLRANCWKTHEKPAYAVFHHQSMNFMNGSIHYIAHRKNFWGTTVFVAFSLAEEKFVAEVPQPDHVDGVEFREMIVFDGCLCMCRVDSDNSGIEIWVMKEYMVKSSWTKLYTVLLESIPYLDDRLRPLCYSGDGDILLEIEITGLAKYNMQERNCSNTFYHITDDYFNLEGRAYLEALAMQERNCSNTFYHVTDDCFNLEGRAFLEALPYVESLVSPHYADARNSIV